MRIRRLNMKEDRVKYALNKKLLEKLGWQDGDIIDQIPLKLQQLALFNVSLNDRLKVDKELKEDYQDINDFSLIAQVAFERQKRFLEIKKKHSKKERLYGGGKSYALAMSKLNRGLLTEPQALKKEKIPKKLIRNRIKLLNAELRSLKSELKVKSKKKSSS